MLNKNEEQFVELVLEIGKSALDQDTFQFMMRDGIPVDEFVDLCNDYQLDEVVQSLEQKGLAYTESQTEILRHTDIQNGESVPVNWARTRFETADRRYIYFTEKLEALYRE